MQRFVLKYFPNNQYFVYIQEKFKTSFCYSIILQHICSAKTKTVGRANVVFLKVELSLFVPCGEESYKPVN